jgi:GxxExxY protein
MPRRANAGIKIGSIKSRGGLSGLRSRCIGVLGPGLRESAYETCLAYELRQLGFRIEQQRPLPVVYKDVKLDCGYRLDIVVEDAIILEVKAIEQLAPIHDAHLLSYLRISGMKVGLLMNFHVRVLKNGLKRIVNEFPDSAFSASSAIKKNP